MGYCAPRYMNKYHLENVPLRGQNIRREINEIKYCLNREKRRSSWGASPER